MIGWYYLHMNGDLIWKKFRPEEEAGGFVRKVWSFDPADRGNAWVIVTEALALGARKDRVEELISKWRLTDEDAQEFAKRANLKLFMDGDEWCAGFHDFVDLQESQAGFGPRCVDAIANLARQGLCAT